MKGNNKNPPTRAGRIPFTPPGTNLKCETAYWLWGDLSLGVPPLIILHGGPGAPGRDWVPFTMLNEQYGVPVILYDQIGCGASTHLPATKGDTTFWRTELFLSELNNLKDFLEIEQFSLLGHSDGGIPVISYALTQPTGLHKLIIASCSAAERLRIQSHLRRRAELGDNLSDFLFKCENEGQLDLPEYQSCQLKFLQRYFCLMDPWPPEIQDVMSLMQEDDTVPFTMYGPIPLKTTGPRKDFDVVGRLSEITDITIPGGVLLTNGRYDMTQDEAMEPFFTEIRARVKWCQFAESSHMPHLEEPKAYLTALGRFLTMK